MAARFGRDSALVVGLFLLGVVACVTVLVATLDVGKAKGSPSAPTFLGEVAAAEVPGGFVQSEAGPNDIAVDKSDDRYVTSQNRVVKFSPYGAFILSFGKEVDRTKVGLRQEDEAKSEPVTVTTEQENICTAASGDDCSGEGGQGSAADQFSRAAGVSVEQASGDVYVEDRFNSRVQKFDSSGHFLRMFGLDVNKVKAEAVKVKEAKAETPTATELAEANLCVAGEACQQGKQGSGEGAFTSDEWLSGAKVVAVGGPVGKEVVFVGGEARIQVFNGQGGFVRQLSLASISATAKVKAITADSAGDVFFVDQGVAGVREAVPNGGGELELSATRFDESSTGVQAVAVDGAGKLYAGDGSPSFRVLVYEVGKPAEAPTQFAGSEPGELTETTGIAVDGAGTVNVASRALHGYKFYGSLAAMEGVYGQPPSLKPAVSFEAVRAGVESSSATIEAEINPELRETTYQVEYGSEPCSLDGCTKVPVSPVSLGSITKTGHQVSVGLIGLQTGTLYHYRLIVKNAAGATERREQVFHIGVSQSVGSVGLPDGRLYEEVTPPDKFGNEVVSNRPAFVAPDGQAVEFGASGAMSDQSSSNTFFAQAVSERTSKGWATRGAMPMPASGQNEPEENLGTNATINWVVPSEHLTHLLFNTSGDAAYLGLPDETKLGNNLFLEGSDPFAEPEWVGRSLIEGSPAGTESSGFFSELSVAGTSPDMKTIYFSYEGTLFPGASHLYEYREGVLSDAGSLPGGETGSGKAAPAAQPLQRHGSTSDPAVISPAAYDNQVSSDGSRIFFTRNNAAGKLELYVHLTPSDGSQSTELVSQSQLPGHMGEPAPDGPLAVPSTQWRSFFTTGLIIQEQENDLNPPYYAYATPDGSHVFFESVDQLTASAPNDKTTKTYEFDLETSTLEYLPALTGSIVSVSKDGSSLIFENTAATPFVLERWTTGPGGGVTPIAQMPPVSKNDCHEVLCVGPAYMSSDGKVLVFSTESPIAGFNDGGTHHEINGNNQPVLTSSIPNREIFRYDAKSGQLSCVSCPPKGMSPSGNAVMSNLAEYYNVPTDSLWYDVDTPGRAISSDGSRVFFQTQEALMPQDINGTIDVYEWENGKVYLISSGSDSDPSLLVGTSESSGDVFFTTSEGIAPGDTDGSNDIYDARIPRPGDSPPEPAPCEGAVCQGPPSVPQLLGVPASEAFNGAGNVTPTPTPSHVGGKSLTRAQRLARALKACRRDKRVRKRKRCEGQARRKYGASVAGARSSAKQARHHNGRGK